jgi:hypothetical protein
MPQLQNRFWVLLIILPLLVMAGTGFLLGESRLYQNAHYGKLYENNILWLAKGGDVKQEFVATYPGLSQVDVFVTPQLSFEQATLTLYLRDTCWAESDLRIEASSLPGGQIDGQRFYTFRFAPLAESRDQKYCFILTSDTSVGSKNLVGILASQANAYLEGQAFYDQPVTSSLPASFALSGEAKLFLPIIRRPASLDYNNIDVAFQTHYDSSHFRIVEVFLARLIENKPFIWGNPSFYIFLLGTNVVGITVLIGVLLRRLL